MKNSYLPSAFELKIIRKLERYCAYQERCVKEVMTKLKTLQLTQSQREMIIHHLIEEDFIDESRFAKIFTSGKFHIKKWGKQRIVRELKSRNINDKLIQTAINDIPEDEYLRVFQQVSDKKINELKQNDTDQIKRKLYNYLVYRGWEFELISEKLNSLSK